MQKNEKNRTTEAKNSEIPGFRIEIDKIHGGLSILVHGVTSIKDFSTEYAVFRSSKKLVKINGKELSIAVYEGKSAEVFGKITGVEFI